MRPWIEPGIYVTTDIMVAYKGLRPFEGSSISDGWRFEFDSWIEVGDVMLVVERARLGRDDRADYVVVISNEHIGYVLESEIAMKAMKLDKYQRFVRARTRQKGKPTEK